MPTSPVEHPRRTVYACLQRALDCVQDVGERELEGRAGSMIEIYWNRIGVLENRYGREPSSVDVVQKLRAAARQLSAAADKLERSHSKR